MDDDAEQPVRSASVTRARRKIGVMPVLVLGGLSLLVAAAWLTSAYVRVEDNWASHSAYSAAGELPSFSGETGVGAFGRIEPRDGVIRLAGPPHAAVVIEKLHVEEGDHVHAGQVIATLMGIGAHRAELGRLQAELGHAERELTRKQELYRKRLLSDSDWEQARLQRDMASAAAERAQADLDLSTVRSPIEAQVLRLHARAGERVDPDGIVELGRTNEMYAIAEVYEADIGRVRIGQRARVQSPALARNVEGSVEHIGLEIGKKDTLSTDPVADADARVVEVKIRLDDSASVARLTNLRVRIVIEP